MKRYLQRIFLAGAILCAGACQSGPTNLPGPPFAHTFAQLSATEFICHDDGAHDDSIAFTLGPALSPLANIDGVMVLIDHLDDAKLTLARVEPSEVPIAVPVGYVCLDVLMCLSSRQSIVRIECGDDGWGSCIQTGYYYPPDVLTRAGGACEMALVKRAWQAAMVSGELHWNFQALTPQVTHAVPAR